MNKDVRTPGALGTATHLSRLRRLTPPPQTELLQVTLRERQNFRRRRGGAGGGVGEGDAGGGVYQHGDSASPQAATESWKPIGCRTDDIRMWHVNLTTAETANQQL